MKLLLSILLSLNLVGFLYGQNSPTPKQALEIIREQFSAREVTPEMVLTLEANTKNENPVLTKENLDALAGLPQEAMKSRAMKAVNALTEENVARMLDNAAKNMAITKGMSGVRQIAVALHMYAADHEDQFPMELKALADGAYIDAADLKRVSSISLPDGALTMEYVPNLSQKNPTAIMLHSSKSIGGERIISRVDASVMKVSEEQFAAEMKATNEWIKKNAAK